MSTARIKGLDFYRQWADERRPARMKGQLPGNAGLRIDEHYLRDILGRQVSGLVEVPVPFGRADVMTNDTVFEVETLRKWREGVRQVLAYHAVTSLTPAIAIFGDASSDDVLRIYLKLRSSPCGVQLWCYHGDGSYTSSGWTHISSRAACRAMRAPDMERIRSVAP